MDENNKSKKFLENVYRIMYPFDTAERPNLKRTFKRLGIEDEIEGEMRKTSIGTELERQLQLRETPQRTFERHRVRQTADAICRERETEKQRLQDSMGVLGSLSDGEGMDMLINLNLRAKKERKEIQRQAKEARARQDKEYYERTARAAWLRDEKLIEESRRRREAELVKARIRRRGYP